MHKNSSERGSDIDKSTYMYTCNLVRGIHDVHVILNLITFFGLEFDSSSSIV